MAAPSHSEGRGQGAGLTTSALRQLRKHGGRMTAKKGAPSCAAAQTEGSVASRLGLLEESDCQRGRDALRAKVSGDGSRNMSDASSSLLLTVSQPASTSSAWFPAGDAKCRLEKLRANGKAIVHQISSCRSGLIEDRVASRETRSSVPKEASPYASKGKATIYDVPVAMRPRALTCCGSSKASRLCCHIYLDERMLKSGVDLVPAIIGRGGGNTRAIFDATGTKLRIRGRGSGHLELDSKKEANVHLMIALSADHGRPDCFQKAFKMAVNLASVVAARFEVVCQKQGKTVPSGPRLWIGGASERSLASLGKSAESLSATLITPVEPASDQPARRCRC